MNLTVKISPIATLVGAMLLTACGQNSNTTTTAATADTTPSTSTTGDTATTSDIVARFNSGGVWTVGTEGTYPPFTYHDETGKLTGYDVEVTRAIADKLGVTVDFKETQWDSMMVGLDTNRFDSVANQVSLNTPERQAKYVKSEPYAWSNAVVVAPKNITLTSWEDIKGKKSAQSLTSNYGEMAQKYGAEVIGVEGLAQTLALVNQGRADLTINDNLAVLEYLKNKPNSGLEIKLHGDDSEKRGAGIIFRKGEEEAVAKVSDAMKALQADGTLTRISEQFFGADISQK